MVDSSTLAKGTSKQPLKIVAAALALLGLLCIGIFFVRGGGNGKLTWDQPIVRKSLMTFAYKIYGDPAAQNGRYFLSKIVFHNDGTGPVSNLEVSYQIPDYVSWTTPEKYSEIPGGQTVVQLYYPQLPSKVTGLTSSTTATLETKIRWSDKSGETKEEILKSNIQFRGVNEIEYTDLPANELLTWYDMFATSPFAASMVTPNDPVVKEFVAEVTKRTGGTTAGISGGGQEIYRIMKAIYDYMYETGMRYTSDAGVPTKIGDVQTIVQNVRLPRDVIITNEGLCIELALLWSSVMEYLGCETTVVFRPGHAFTVVRYGQGTSDFIPIECTAISPMAVGAKEAVSFDDAIKMAAQDIQQQKYQIWVNVQNYQKQGFRAPELPNIEIDKIKNILSARSNHTAAAYTGGAGTGAKEVASSGQLRQGYYRWVGVNNTVSIDVPETWTRLENSPVPGMIFTAQDMQTSVAVNIFHYPNLATAEDAMETAKKGVSRVGGGKVKVTSQQRKGNNIIYTGTTSYRNGSTQWVGVFGPAQQGVVGLFVGAAKGQFEKNQPIIQDIISNARLGGTDASGGGNASN